MRPIGLCIACKQSTDRFYLITLPLSEVEIKIAEAEEKEGIFRNDYPQICPSCIKLLVDKAARKYRIGNEAVLTLVSDSKGVVNE
jgi:hypothetical protein